MSKPIPIKIISVNEPWCEATLEDGSIIRAKLVFISTYRQVNEDGSLLFDEKGVPSYQVNTQALIGVEWDGKIIEEQKVTGQVLKLVEPEKDK